MFTSGRRFGVTSNIKVLATEMRERNTTNNDSQDDAVESAHHAAMDAYWTGVGACDKDLVAYLINPMFMGAPAWPNVRQAFRVVRTPTTLIIASDGLSDPCPANDVAAGDDRSGLGMEVFIEVKGLQDLSFNEIKMHWAFAAVECFARNVANMRGIVPTLEENGVMSIELPIEKGPAGDAWLKPNGMLGALIDAPQGSRANTVATPIKPVRIVPITILTAAEVDKCPGSAAERAQLAEELGGHVTDPARATLR